VHPAMGVFQHEAAAVDPAGKRVYLTEDLSSGGFYRFTPTNYPDLSAGLLEIARVGAGGAVEWVKVPDPAATTTATRDQVPGATRFRRGEGLWFDSGTVYVATTGDSRIHAYDTKSERIEVLYDAGALENPPLTDVDNITVSRSGDLFVCEDTGGVDPFDIGLITPDRRVSRFLKVTGPQHGQGDTDASSELAGVVFDPSGRRMYFASQRAFFTGVVYEVTGPFRTSAAQANPPIADEEETTTEDRQAGGRRRNAGGRTRDDGGSAQQGERSSFSGEEELPFSGYPLAGPAAAGAASVAAGLALRRAARRKHAAEDPVEDES